jgi:hypothetical protein
MNLNMAKKRKKSAEGGSLNKQAAQKTSPAHFLFLFLSLSHTHTHTLSVTITLCTTHFLFHSIAQFFSMFVSHTRANSLTFSLTFILSRTHTLSLSSSLSLTHTHFFDGRKHSFEKLLNLGFDFEKEKKTLFSSLPALYSVCVCCLPDLSRRLSGYCI